MQEIIPWDEWMEYIHPYYLNSKRGRPAKGIEKMLRMNLLQIWFNLSDEGIEDAICDGYTFCKFMGINFFDEQAPDVTTLFRHLIEKNQIGEQLFRVINYVLGQGGAMMKGGTIVDVTIIKARNPKMHSTKKGNEWRFGMKSHIGVDVGSGYVHTITATATNVHDIEEAYNLLRDEIKNDEHFSTIDFNIVRRPKGLPIIS